MDEQTRRNLFRYPLWLMPEASFIVRRNEPVYAILIPLWLKARGLLPTSVVVHGIMPSITQLAVALVCERPYVFDGDGKSASQDITKAEIRCCFLPVDFPGAEEAMPALNTFILTCPHLRYVESWRWDGVLDTHTITWLMEREDARR